VQENSERFVLPSREEKDPHETPTHDATAGLLFLILTAWIAWTGAAAPQGPAAPLLGLSVENGRLIKDGRPYRGVGGNYFDLFLRVLRHPDDSSTLEGLRRLSEGGIPFVRFCGGGYSPEEWKVYIEQKDEYFRRFDRVVDAAERAKVGLIPSLFWTLAPARMLGETRDQWGKPAQQDAGFHAAIHHRRCRPL